MNARSVNAGPFAYVDGVRVRISDATLKRLASRVDRAKSAIGKVKAYRLGKGGFNPNAPHPGDSCDCSGFVSWVIGLSRMPKPSRPWWIETTNIFRDATGRQSTFVPCDPFPGCLIVYPDRKVKIWKSGVLRLASKQGHVAVVAEVGADGKPLRIVDCSARADGVAVRRSSLVFPVLCNPSSGDFDGCSLCCTLLEDVV